MSQMVTTCPNCRQQLAVTAADLRVGQGFVRCGRCDKVFNALLTLTEDATAPSEPESVAHGTSSMPTLDEQEVLPPLPGREKDEDAPFDLDDEVEVVQTHVTGQFRSVVLEGDRVRADELIELGTGDEPAAEGDNEGKDDDADAEVDRLDLDVGEELVATDGAKPAPDLDLSITPDRDEVAREIIRQATSQPIDILLEEERADSPAKTVAAAPVPRPAPEPGPESYDADDMLGPPPRPARLWYVAAVLLALVLAGQYAHLNRQRLVTVPWLERTVQAVYGLFGESVEPAWDLAQYEISRLGELEAANGGRTLVQRAAVAVKKDARRAQPPPLLRVVLSDRFGNELATHDVAPGDWLLDPARAPARLAPGERLDAQLSLPGNERIAGIALYACLPDAAGTAHCNDQILR